MTFRFQPLAVQAVTVDFDRRSATFADGRTTDIVSGYFTDQHGNRFRARLINAPAPGVPAVATLDAVAAQTIAVATEEGRAQTFAETVFRAREALHNPLVYLSLVGTAAAKASGLPPQAAINAVADLTVLAPAMGPDFADLVEGLAKQDDWSRVLALYLIATRREKTA